MGKQKLPHIRLRRQGAREEALWWTWGELNSRLVKPIPVHGYKLGFRLILTIAESGPNTTGGHKYVH